MAQKTKASKEGIPLQIPNQFAKTRLTKFTIFKKPRLLFPKADALPKNNMFLLKLKQLK